MAAGILSDLTLVHGNLLRLSLVHKDALSDSSLGLVVFLNNGLEDRDTSSSLLVEEDVSNKLDEQGVWEH